MRQLIRALPILAAGLLASCGTLPEPFYGNPGKSAAILAMPPPPELIVTPPTHALLPRKAADAFASTLSASLIANDVPSLTTASKLPQWRLRVDQTRLLDETASATGSDMIAPIYSIIGPDGKNYGTMLGTPAPLAPWMNGDAATLAATAKADGPKLASLLTAINMKVQHANPNSLENRIPRVFVGTGSGAPGDGDSALPLDLARDLPDTGVILTNDQATADFSVTVQVKTSPQPDGSLIVELDWFVADSNGRTIGQVTQLHQLAPSDIEPYWGDVAAAAAKQAAGGVREAISHAVLKPS